MPCSPPWMTAPVPLFVTVSPLASTSTPSPDPPRILPWLMTVESGPRTSTPSVVPEISAAVPLLVRTLPGRCWRR